MSMAPALCLMRSVNAYDAYLMHVVYAQIHLGHTPLYYYYYFNFSF